MSGSSHNSRRQFILKSALGGMTMAALSQSISTAKSNGKTIVPPADTEMLPQPDCDVTLLASFSRKTKRVAAAAGTLNNTKLYVDNPDHPDTFTEVWSSNADITQIHAIEWSPDERYIAFIVETVYLNDPSNGWKAKLFVADVSSGATSELIASTGSPKSVTEDIVVDWKGGLAWKNNNDICLRDEDHRLFVIERETGNTNTVFPSQQDTKIHSFAVTETGNVRFLKNVTSPENRLSSFAGLRGIAVDIEDIESGVAVNHSKVMKNDECIVAADLSPDGENVFLHTLSDSGANVNIHNVRDNCITKKIPIFSHDGMYYHYYVPVEMLNNTELAILDISVLSSDGESLFGDIQGTLDDNMIPLSVNASSEPCCKLKKVRL